MFNARFDESRTLKMALILEVFEECIFYSRSGQDAFLREHRRHEFQNKEHDTCLELPACYISVVQQAFANKTTYQKLCSTSGSLNGFEGRIQNLYSL